MKVSNKYLLKIIGDDAMLIPMNNDYMSVQKLINLNETSLFIYRKLQDGLNFETILSEMEKEYDATRDIMEKDLKDTINKFKELGVIDE